GEEGGIWEGDKRIKSSKFDCNGMHQSSEFSMAYQEPYMAPKLSAVQWEDERTYCFQVECHNIVVARRNDTHFVNGTKLLNVVGMTRGKRDGILKGEPGRHVIKSGSMALKGVWIPLQRAKQLAKEHGVFTKLYPLFEPDIESFYYSPMVSITSHPIDIELSSTRWTSFSSHRSTRSYPPNLTLPPISVDAGSTDLSHTDTDLRGFSYDSTPTEGHFPHDPFVYDHRASSDLNSPFFATPNTAYSFFTQPPTTPVSPTFPNSIKDTTCHLSYHSTNQDVSQNTSLLYHA
ncbi:basic helix-loop-helix transcription factor, partial [Massospora cicadina]